MRPSNGVLSASCLTFRPFSSSFSRMRHSRVSKTRGGNRRSQRWLTVSCLLTRPASVPAVLCCCLGSSSIVCIPLVSKALLLGEVFVWLLHELTIAQLKYVGEAYHISWMLAHRLGHRVFLESCDS